MSELHRRGQERRESGAFLLATRGEISRRVTRIVYYDDLDPDCLQGGIAFSGFGFSALWDICVDEGFELIADVHTHPGQSVAQSSTDRKHPMYPRAGHIALIIPSFASPPVRSRQIGVHEYFGDAGWQSHFGHDAEHLVYIGWVGMSINPDHVHRTVKLEMDFGRARDLEDAERIVRGYVLQVRVGPGVARSQTRQATLLTAVNAGSRAFLGGVRVKMDEDFEMTTPWDHGRRASETLADFDNISFVDEHDRHRPVIVIGDADWDGELPLYPTWEGWAAGVVPSRAERLAEQAEFTLAGVLSGALAVSEAFQWTRGYQVAAARSVGLSLWAPDRNWRLRDAAGPQVAFLPDNFWLLGLGHLGQAYAWALGFLPFPSSRRGTVRVMLQDVDEIVDANEATSLLVRDSARGLKTHLAARQLERLGMKALITDRRFDGHTRRSDSDPAEPRLALAGFDKLAPRRLMEDAGFGYIVDAGLGVGPIEYLGIDIHTFPASRRAREIFADDTSPSATDDLLDKPAYRAASEAAMTSGEAGSREAARCGLIDLAGKAAGAAFVGAAAATVALSELLRIVNGGDRYETFTINLRTPDGLVAYRNPQQMPITNPGFIEVDGL